MRNYYLDDDEQTKTKSLVVLAAIILFKLAHLSLSLFSYRVTPFINVL